jgi:hypothetical protein
MMKKVLVLIMVCLFFACNRKEDVAKEDSEVQKPYIISKKKREISSKNNSIPPPPPIPGWFVYGTNTFIIGKDSKIYYFQRNRAALRCGTGSENDTIPHFIDLQPKDLIKIPKDCIDKFIDVNVMTKEKRKQILIMASQTDIIKDQKFLSFLYNTKVPTYVIRRTTQEEDTVLSYKKKNAFYYSDSIKWDKTRIKFPENIKFIKRPTETAN